MTTENTKVEKKLLYVDQSQAKGLEKVHIKGLSILTQLTNHYNQLSIGNITRKRLDEIFNNDFTGIENDVWNVANGDLKKFKTQFISDALRQETEGRILQFKQQAMKLVKRFVDARFFGANDYPLVHENFTICGGKIELSETDLQKLITEHCAVCIETPEQAEFWQMLQETAEKCNQCKKFLIEHEIETPLFFQQYHTPGFLAENPDDISLNPKEMMF